MNDDSNLIFERYLESINEAFQPWTQSRKKGLGKTSLVRHTTQITARDEIREQNINIAIKNGTIVNILNALTERFYKGNTKKVKLLMAEYTGVGNSTTKTMFNPLEYGLKDYPYTIPLYDIPNRILSVQARHPQITGHTIDQNLQRNLLKNYYQLLCDLYRENGGNPDDVNELEMVLSFPTKIHHEFKKWGDENRDVLRPQMFGGESEADRNNQFVHINNVRELQGRNWDRLSKEEKIGNLLFWGDPRSGTSKDTTYKPDSAKTPENLAGKTLENPDRKSLTKKTKAWPKFKGTPEEIEKKKKEKLVPAFGSTEPEPEKKEEPKPTKKKKPTKKAPTKKGPTKTKVKESYQPFIRIIPF